jgi:hypothetical protein
MTYVPTPVVSPQASIQARELAQRIEHTIMEYRQNHRNLSDTEVQQALQIAQSRTGGAQRARLLVAVALGVAGLLLFGALVFGLLAR